MAPDLVAAQHKGTSVSAVAVDQAAAEIVPAEEAEAVASCL